MVKFNANKPLLVKIFLKGMLMTPVIFGLLPFFEGNIGKVEAELSNYSLASLNHSSDFIFFQENSLIQVPIFLDQKNLKKQRMVVTITAYSSSLWETDDTPYWTASGTFVREGIVANNFLPFGTKIKIPDLFGEKVFVVEDRMNPRCSDFQVDIWFPEHRQALNFGKKITYIEILNE